MADLPSAIGRYEIISRLGQGGMGSLYLARDPKIGRLVAIKLVRQEFDSPEARQRFAREAQSAGTLRHPNIVTIFDVDEHEGLPYIAMEYVDGETLSEIVRRRAPYPVTRRLQWTEELCAGLAYAHRQGVVHRDIKPANLMLDNEGTLKILDFGLARREATKFTQSQTIIGTPNYMSPEQIRAGDIGPGSDIFAVGAVLYELMAYAEAFPGRIHEAMHKVLYEEPKPLSQVAPGVDAGIEAVLAHAIEKDPSRRFSDLAQMRHELALVRQRLEQQMAELVPTLSLTPGLTPPRRSGSDPRPTPLSGAPVSTPGSGSRRATSQTHRLSLQKKRAAQIELHLAEARRHSDAGAFEMARESLEQALIFDPDHPTGLQLMDEIAAEEERYQVAQFVAASRVALQQGRLDEAELMVAKAFEIAPQSRDVLQLRETIETTRRELERARQIQDRLRRARMRFSEGSFEGAIRAVGELLAIDPDNAAARDLQARAQEALDAHARRADRDTAAQAAVTEARALFEKGDKDSAIARLEGFAPPHDLVSGFLASLRGEQVAEALEEPGAAAPVPLASATAAASPAGAIAPATRSRPPVYAGLAVAAALVVGVSWYMTTRAGRSTASPPAVAAVETAPAPAPVIPPPAVVTPPASLTARPPVDQNARDAMAAYKLLSSGQHVEAATIVAAIARRDPKNENLADLRAQIAKVADTEKLRADAAAAATVSPPAPAAAGEAVPAAPAPVPAPKPDVPVSPAGSAAPASELRVPTPADVERPSIEASIQEYARALSSRDLAAVARVRRYSPIEARNWENAFKQFAEYRLIVKVTGNPIVEGDRATIPVEEVFSQTAKKGGIQVFLQPRKTEYKLEKLGGKWMLLPPG